MIKTCLGRWISSSNSRYSIVSDQTESDKLTRYLSISRRVRRLYVRPLFLPDVGDGDNILSVRGAIKAMANRFQNGTANGNANRNKLSGTRSTTLKARRVQNHCARFYCGLVGPTVSHCCVADLGAQLTKIVHRSDIEKITSNCQGITSIG